MPLTQQQEQAFWNWLAAKGIPTECPFCHAQQNKQFQNLQCGEMFEAPATITAGNVQMLQVVCNNCAFVSLFNIDPTKPLTG